MRCLSPYALAVHGNQRHNDLSLVFHFSFMERDSCPKDNCQWDCIGKNGWDYFHYACACLLFDTFDCANSRLIDNPKTIVG